ncbi:ribonuclease H-like domain-containing protein [Tanacetum coccineum]|uniref:Ribonuclease H-like domain-containing protein n=1 Tax=Tanacetum coccineum TaxID=301880 RepID=A0ABQ5FHK6_9ASTR
MIDWLSIVETDKVIHTVETDIVKLVVEIKSFSMSSDEFDKETRSFDGLQPMQADLSCVQALNELHLHELVSVQDFRIPNTNVVAETAWLRNRLRELHTPLLSAILVFCDNVSAIYMSANPVQHQRTKHIEIDIHFVCDMVARGSGCVFISILLQVCDIFTKGLPSALFEEFRTSLSVRKRGCVYLDHLNGNYKKFNDKR